MHSLDLIITLAGGFTAAVLFGYVTQRLGWSPIVGYLLAGFLVGPHTPGFVADKHLADQLAEVGVILLMFGVGLQFHIKDLAAVRRVAVAGAICQSLIATALGALAARALGWSWPAGIVFGLALSVASTVVLTRVLADSGDLQSPTGRIAIGWLVMEDIFTVFVLVLLPVVFGASQQSSMVTAFVFAALKLVALIAFTLAAGRRILPWVLTRIAVTHSRELFTLAVLAIALGIAAVSARLLGVSTALAAFLAGMVVGQSEFSARAGAEALPMRDAFAVMFFLSVGMLFDPRQLLQSPLLTLTAVAIVLLGKPIAAVLIVVLLGYGSRIAFGVAVALAQIGEFSFILASLGQQLKVLSGEAMNALVAAAIVSITLNPMLYRLVDPAEAFLRKRPRLWAWLNARGRRKDAEAVVSPVDGAYHRAVVVGYGPVGRTVARLLSDRGIEPTVIEMNLETVHSLQKEGRRVVYGDANQREVLEEADIRSAVSLILTAPSSAVSSEMIRMARELNPEIRVSARSSYLGHAESMRHAGADEVFTGEGEVALAMTDSLLRRLGATPEQLDQERERIRAALMPQAAPPHSALPPSALPPSAPPPDSVIL